jgi:MFS family permease
VLFAGRMLQGAVSGAVFSVASAWVAELSLVGGDGAAGRRAAVAMTAGFSIGPLVAGVLGEYAPLPTTLPYLLHVVLVAVGLAAAVRLPETVDLVRHEDRPAKGPLVDPADRLVLLTVLAPLAVCVYAFPSVVISAVPLLVETSAPPVLLTGVLAGLTLGAGTLAAPLQRRLGPWTAVTAMGCGAAGFGLATLGSGTGSPPLLLGAALLLGSGGGLALASGLALTARLARPGRRGALSAVFLGCAYLGFGCPFLTAVTAEASAVQVPLAAAAVVVTVLGARLAVATRRGQLRG